MINKNTYTLINPQTANLAFKYFSFEDNSFFDHIQRLNYYSLIWIQKGNGKVKADCSEFDFLQNQLLAFAPYQPFMLATTGEVQGIVIHFHPDFLCIHKHHQEVACNGVLFNNIYDPPYVFIDELTQKSFIMALEQIKIEIQNPAVAQYELLISYLKIILITASRIKKEQQALLADSSEPEAAFVLQNLKNYIELHFKTKLSASDYADLLHITPKALGKIVKTYFNKALTDLIAERIVIEAKQELYLTNNTVKEIAYELGYDDEHYFSRFFKNNADVSPQMYRETVGFDRAVN